MIYHISDFLGSRGTSYALCEAVNSLCDGDTLCLDGKELEIDNSFASGEFFYLPRYSNLKKYYAVNIKKKRDITIDGGGANLIFKGDVSAFGLDFGYTNDPSTLFCGLLDLTNKRLFVFDEMYEKYGIDAQNEVLDDIIEKLSKFVRSFCSQENLLDLDKEAMARLVEVTSKLAGDKEKLSTQFSEIGEIVGEASVWAKKDKQKIITKEYIQKALDERIERSKKYDTRYLQMIKEEALLIDTEGFAVGQVNGLTVIKIGDFSFGKPARITASTYMGKEGIINIEREIEMSGPSHSKGVLILNGYLGEQFAQDMPLSLTANLCFEQLYGGVDGDSASSTEAYAMLSSLSGIPINQSIAVTGSINQKGYIQPIGGVNEKIEGFYQTCKLRGFNGEQGVIIPVQNVRNLHLSDEIIDSVRKGKFHVYAVSTIDEGIEILTGVPAGKKDKNGKFPLGTINYLAHEKLKKFSGVANK